MTRVRKTMNTFDNELKIPNSKMNVRCSSNAHIVHKTRIIDVSGADSEDKELKNKKTRYSSFSPTPIT